MPLDFLIDNALIISAAVCLVAIAVFAWLERDREGLAGTAEGVFERSDDATKGIINFTSVTAAGLGAVGASIATGALNAGDILTSLIGQDPAIAGGIGAALVGGVGSAVGANPVLIVAAALAFVGLGMVIRGSQRGR